MLEAVAAARRLRAVYQRAADVLLVATSWRGAESEGAFYGRIAYPLTLARAFAVVSFTAVRS